MPGTPTEMATLAVELHETPPDHVWNDGSPISSEEIRDIDALRAYHWRIAWEMSLREPRNPAQEVAMSLLKSLLSDRQRGELKRMKYFYVRGSRGGMYRIDPRRGHTKSVTRNGSRFFVLSAFCLHDDRSIPSQSMPPADLSIAHMLMIVSDEDDFLKTANATNARREMWNRDYLRGIREAREERRREAART